MPETMTPRERWLAALTMQPVDRLPFWPKIGGPYCQSQSGPYRELNGDEMHEFIGSDRHAGVPSGVTTTPQRCRRVVETTDTERHACVETPVGTLNESWRYDAGSCSWHPVEFPIKSAADLPTLQAWYEDQQVAVNREQVAIAHDCQATFGESACTQCGVGTTPLMDFIQHLAGVELGHFLLVDAEDDVLALFEAMQRVLRERARLTAEVSPSDTVYLVENTSTTLISPQQYRTLNKPHVDELAGIIEDAGKICILHMCGHLKAILPDLATTPARAFEAYTTPPVGSATLNDGRADCSQKCFVGGTNASIWDQSAERIIEAIGSQLDTLPHHRGLVITSAGVMPPRCPPDVIRQVRDFVADYAVRN